MFKKRFYPYFEADGGAGGAGGEGDPGNGGEGGEGEKEKTFDELLKENKEFQAEFDRRMNKGIETAVTNARKKFEKMADDKISEAEKLAQMNELEKTAYLQKKKQEELEKQQAELDRRELKAQAVTDLAEKGLPSDLADMLDYTSADTVKATMATVVDTYNKAVAAGVEAKLKGGKPPKAATNNDDDDEKALNKEIYSAMSGD